MPSAFSRTTRSLDADRARFTTPILVVCLLLLVAWGGWLLFATVPLYEVAESARLEVTDAVHPVATAVSGRVVTTRMAIGRTVETGEVLVELDAAAERLALAEAAARLSDLTARSAALQSELRAHEEALQTHHGASGVASEEARAQAAEAEARARLAEAEAERTRQLLSAGAATHMEWERASTEADAKRAHAGALALAVVRQSSDRGVAASDRGARISELRRQIVELQGEADVEQARIRRLEFEVEQRRIRAPVAGKLGDVAMFEPGAVVQSGTLLGSVVPSSDLRVVAYFPATALGHIRPAQQARVRLAGFSWTEFGRLSAIVTEVAAEAPGGQFRAELRLVGPHPPLIPVEHGLPGSAEVEVERVSPLTLVLRAAGRTRASERPTGASMAAVPGR